MAGVFFSLAVAKAAASDVSFGSCSSVLRCSLGKVAEPDRLCPAEEGGGGGGGGGGGAAATGVGGCCATGGGAEFARWWLYWAIGDGVVCWPGVVGWLEWLAEAVS